jgi:peptide/nickel transport system substrate-binding protein
MNEFESRMLETTRAHSADPQNHLIDEFIAGRLTRLDFVRRGTVLGLSLPLLGAFASSSSASTLRRKAGGTIRAAIVTPTGAVDPVTVADTGGAVMLQQTGQYLAFSSGDLKLVPVLAQRWKPNHDASVHVHPQERRHVQQRESDDRR